MGRRFAGNMTGEQYCGNKNTKEVHDLDQETNVCNINEIIESGHDVSFTILNNAHSQGYDNCAFCLGSSNS